MREIISVDLIMITLKLMLVLVFIKNNISVLWVKTLSFMQSVVLAPD